MVKSDFYYDLPPELIAQTPLEQRDHSRLMVLSRKDGTIQHSHFFKLPAFLKRGDLLVLNDSRVLPARIIGQKIGSDTVVEFLLLKPKGDKIWEVIVRPGRRLKEGAEVIFGEGLLKATIQSVLPDGNRIVQFSCKENIYTVLDQIGQMPLPPYIKKKLLDKERYQTVYSREVGSAAAPTAGLHFTKELLQTIQNEGIRIAYVTLHVGLGTFRPVKVNNITDHIMHSEHYILPQKTADLINQAKEEGGRIISVGTTSCRTLESAKIENGKIQACEGDTSIFIYPGYTFRVIDGLLTNFHLPESTLIMLVSAFAGYESIMHAYQVAVQEKYRFFSFGDAMLLL